MLLFVLGFDPLQNLAKNRAPICYALLVFLTRSGVFKFLPLLTTDFVCKGTHIFRNNKKK